MICSLPMATDIMALAALALVVGATGCATDSATFKSTSAANAERLIQVDSEFCAFAKTHSLVEAFTTFASEEATCFPMGESPVHGREAICQMMAAGPKGKMTWTPTASDLARSGDLGYTWGTYEFRGRSDEGQPLVRRGKYVTIWKRQRDGSWRFVVDMGNPGPTTQ